MTRLSPTMTTIAVEDAEGALASALPILLMAHAGERWRDVVNVMRLPEQGVAAAWLTVYQKAETDLRNAWAAFERLQQDLDEAICDWYRFTPAHRMAIVAGLPWARS